MGQDYYVCVHMGFGELFYPVYIICRGPELDGLVIVQSVVYDDDTVMFLA